MTAEQEVQVFCSAGVSLAIFQSFALRKTAGETAAPRYVKRKFNV
jgi:hypothetical protein